MSNKVLIFKSSLIKLKKSETNLNNNFVETEASESDNTTVGKENAMEKIISVEGMMCEHCEATVVKALEQIDGVESAEASHVDNRAVVHLSGEVDDEVLKKAIEDHDYKVTGITD